MENSECVSAQAKALADKTARLREECAALCEYWREMLGEPQPQQIKLWLLEYNAAVIEESITRMAKWVLLHTDEDVNDKRSHKVFKGILRIVHAGGLSDDEKATELSKIRAEAGKVGAAARWQKQRKQALLELSEQLEATHTDGKMVECSVCHRLPCVCQNLSDFCHDVTAGLRLKVNGSRLAVKEVSSKTVTVNGNGLVASPPARKAEPESQNRNLKTDGALPQAPSGDFSSPAPHGGIDSPPATPPRRRAAPKLCPDCHEELKRDENHLLACAARQGKSFSMLDEDDL